MKRQLITLLDEFKDVFAWSYEDMLDLNTDNVVHCLPQQPECKLVKQKLRRMKPEYNMKMKKEVVHQLELVILKMTDYPKWLAKIVPVTKKDGNARMCFYYRDFNKASPKTIFRYRTLTPHG